MLRTNRKRYEKLIIINLQLKLVHYGLHLEKKLFDITSECSITIRPIYPCSFNVQSPTQKTVPSFI